ncbi:MAG: hypothetical protein ABW250_01475 [Pyrinomonadaceae bacterium]
MSEKREQLAQADGQGLIEEFSIMELEERLEFEAWCDNDQCIIVNACDTNIPCEAT